MNREFLYQKFKYSVLEVKNSTDIAQMQWDYTLCNGSIKYLAYDTETTGLDFMNDKPFLVIFGFAKNIYYWNPEFKDATYAMFEIVKSSKKMLFAHNAKYDKHMLYNIGTPIPEGIELSDTITLMRLINDCDNTHASMKLEKIGEQFVDPSAKFASNLIKECLQKIRQERKKVVCDNFKLITGQKSFTKEWLEYTKRVRFITKYHECFNDYVEPNYYDVYLREKEMFVSYGIDDVVILLEFLDKAGRIYAKRYYDSKTKSIDTRIWKQENKLIWAISDMERNGFKIDVDYLVDSHYRILKFKEGLYEKLWKITKKEWSVAQHNEIKAFFKERYGIILVKSDKKAIKNLKNNENKEVQEVAKIILKLRTIDKWLSTYIDGILNKIVEVNGEWKLYTSLNNNGAVSGRVSCDLQQMPKVGIDETEKDENDEDVLMLEDSLSDDDGHELFHPRKFVIPSKGYALYFSDLSQIELRIQAYFTILIGQIDYYLSKSYMPHDCHHCITGEQFDYKNSDHIKRWREWKEGHPNPKELNNGAEDVFNDGWSVWIDNKTNKPWIPTDMHTKTTLSAYPEWEGRTHEKIFKKVYRYLGKGTNFAKNYCCGAKTLADNLDIPLEDAIRLSNAYNNTYTGVIKYQRVVQAELNIKGYVTNLMGRRYYISNSSNYYKGNNYLIQGTAAELLKRAEIQVCEYLKDKKSRFILPIHDRQICRV